MYDSFRELDGHGITRPFPLVKIMARDFAKAFYSSIAWQNCRNEYIKRAHYLCEDCLKRGVYTPGIEVHHIEELTPMNIHRPEVTLNEANLVLLCRNCHKSRHKGQRDRRYTIGPSGEVIINGEA